MRDAVTHLRLDAAGIVATATRGQDHRRKLGGGALVTRRVRIRDVIGDGAKPVRLGVHTGHARSHGAIQTQLDTP
ncbi:hypothetical protein D3C71_2213480 [compost metagenome]